MVSISFSKGRNQGMRRIVALGDAVTDAKTGHTNFETVDAALQALRRGNPRTYGQILAADFIAWREERSAATGNVVHI